MLLELEDLVVDYLEADRPLRAVDHVNLTIRAGEIVGLAGESGCGKTTTANAILSILQPPAEVTGGHIRFRGVDVAGLSTQESRRYRWRNVSMVFQSAMSALNPVMRVGDQFVDMMKAHERVSKRDALQRAGDLLNLVGIDRGRVRAYPHELSGGMRQRVIIAMALALEPELVIMDEPTTALDVVVQREILQELQQLQHELGFAVLFITHDLSLLLEFANRVAIMYAGEIVELAESPELFANSLHPYSLGLLGSFPPLTGPIERLAGIPAARPTSPTRRPGAASIPGARTANPPTPRCSRGRPPSDPCSSRLRPGTRSPVISSRSPAREHHRAGSPRADEGLQEAPRRRRRELHAPAGHDHGARRRERQRQEHRRAHPREAARRDRGLGDLRREGRPRPHATSSSYRSRVQMIFQDPFDSLNPVRTSSTISRGRCGSTASSRGATSTPRVHELLRTVGLVPAEKYAAKYPHELSGGQRQRVAIARALAVNPSVILADEPISMLDVSIRIGILNLMLGLKRELGIAFLYITHDIASARYIADEVLVMYAGQIVEQGPTDSCCRAAPRLYEAPALRCAAPGAERASQRAARRRVARRRLPVRPRGRSGSSAREERRPLREAGKQH